MERKALGKKETRAPNFTTNETRLLVKLCLKAKHIIENKQTNANLWKLKDETWQKICLEFNATSGCTIPRTACGLKARYESMKKHLKRKLIINKEESMKTRGGVPKLEPIEGPEKDLLLLLDLTGMLKGNKENPVLENPNENLLDGGEMECLDSSHKFLEMDSPNQLNDNLLINLDENDEMYADQDTGKTSPDANWSKWNQGLLKTKKRSVLTSSPKGNLQDVGENVDNLMTERQSLVHLQIELLLKEEERKEREHTAVMEKIQQEILLNSKNDERLEKEHLLKMRLLELDIIKKQKV